MEYFVIHFSLFEKSFLKKRIITNKKGICPTRLPYNEINSIITLLNVMYLFENAHCFVLIHVMIKFHLIIIEINNLHHRIYILT